MPTATLLAGGERRQPRSPERRLRPRCGREAGRATTGYAVLVALVAGIAGLEFGALLPHADAPSAPQPAQTAKPLPATIGAVEVPAAEAVVGPTATIAGWALDRAGIRAIEVRVAGTPMPARIGQDRADVAARHPGYPDSAKAGFALTIDVSGQPAPPGSDRRDLTVVAIATDGRETTLARKSLIEPAALVRWRALRDRGPSAARPFYLLPALSGIGLGGARDLDRAYAPYLSPTVRVGMRVPILYLRTTLGPARDYAFDPDWDIERRCGTRRLAEDALNTTIAHAIAHALPVLFTLNGGIWADAACDAPEWDLNDRLEAHKANCQWNEKNEVMPDDYLKHLPGSTDAPELGRSLTFNVYATEVRRYKRRNLQAAARIIATFAHAHPDLFVGVTLDPDTYLNPFFEGQQWYDYNPGTLRQFRHWLAGTGPYAGRRDAPGAPDLTFYRRRNPLTLADASRLAGRDWRRWQDVDPPRSFPATPTAGRPAFHEDPWTREWETFRRHLVHLHYDELSQWVRDAGIAPDRIWSGQGFMAPSSGVPPFAIRIDSPMKTYDTGGMSVEGAKPRYGHLGAIVYGAAAANDIRMEEPVSLFAVFRARDPGWAVVEINTADLRNPKALPTYATAYRSLRDLFNYGARYASPMAWNGSDGNDAGGPGFVTFTAWRNTPFEEAARDFLLAHANVPLGARLWTFGRSRHADADGWSADGGAVVPSAGRLLLQPRDGALALVSPRELALAPRAIDRMVLGFADAAAIATVRVLARAGPGSRWREVAPPQPPSRLLHAAAGIVVPLRLPGTTDFDQLRVELRFAPGSATAALDRVALWPAATAIVSARPP